MEYVNFIFSSATILLRRFRIVSESTETAVTASGYDLISLLASVIMKSLIDLARGLLIITNARHSTVSCFSLTWGKSEVHCGHLTASMCIGLLQNTQFFVVGAGAGLFLLIFLFILLICCRNMNIDNDIIRKSMIAVRNNP